MNVLVVSFAADGQAHCTMCGQAAATASASHPATVLVYPASAGVPLTVTPREPFFGASGDFFTNGVLVDKPHTPTEAEWQDLGRP